MAKTHQIIERVVFYGLLATIVLTAIPYGSVQPWWTALFECVIFVLAILAIIDLQITKDGLPDGASVALPLVLLCLFLMFQSLPLFAADDPVIPGLRLSISADPFTTQLVAMKLLALMLAGLLLLRYVNTERRLYTVVFVVIGVGVASAMLGLLRTGSGPAWFFPLPRPERGFAQFVNRNHFGYVMEMTLGLAAGIAIRGSRSHRERWVLLGLAVFFLITLIISSSRGAIFAAFCEILFLLIAINPARLMFGDSEDHQESRVRGLLGGLTVKVVLVLGLVLVFAYGVRWVGGEAVVRNIELTGDSFTEQGGHEQRENVSRSNIWAATWKLAKAHPFVGSGFGAYWIAITRYHDASGKFTPQEAHNDYLEAIAAGGLVGLGLILWCAWRFLKRARHALTTQSRWAHAAALGALTGVFGVMIHSFVEFGLHIPSNALMFTTLLVVATRKSFPSVAIERVSGFTDDRAKALTTRDPKSDAALV